MSAFLQIYLFPTLHKDREIVRPRVGFLIETVLAIVSVNIFLGLLESEVVSLGKRAYFFLVNLFGVIHFRPLRVGETMNFFSLKLKGWLLILHYVLSLFF